VEVHDGSGTDRENADRARWLKLSGGVSITIGNNIYLSGDAVGEFGTLAHELTHVYQFQVQYKGDLAMYLTNGFGNQASDWLYRRTRGAIGRNEYAVGTLLADQKPFAKYRMNQQAEIVRLCVTGIVPWACGVSPFRP
jgi:hypothetical protein